MNRGTEKQMNRKTEKPNKFLFMNVDLEQRSQLLQLVGYSVRSSRFLMFFVKMANSSLLSAIPFLESSGER